MYLNLNLFKLYFSNSKVEVPRILRGTSSLTRQANNINSFKFTKHLMSHGNFVKILLQLNLSWQTSILKSNCSMGNYNWHTLYLLNQNYNSFCKNFFLTKNSFTEFLSNYTRKAYAIFSLYIYKVNKNIYKNTRGKSGKFMFVWKYVPVYKRLFISLAWLMKELRALPHRKLAQRLTTLLYNMSTKPLKTWPLRVKSFSYNYVYRNCRSTLASSYISTKV